jgi:hypothetical protein
MRVLSIDVGIKNLAYCLLEADLTNKTYKIIKWDVLNLLCETNFKCNHTLQSKKSIKEKKDEVCDKKATHSLNDKFACSLHMKKLYPENISLKTLKKAKVNKLIELATKYNLTCNDNKKQTLMDVLEPYIRENMFQEINVAVSANHMDLVSIGVSIRDLFDVHFPCEAVQGTCETAIACEAANEVAANVNYVSIDKIIIENQISPIANRMKSIQGMIAQYFIMKNKTDISFISSANKLKYFLEGKKTEYSERKKLSVDITKGLLSKKNEYSTNLSYFTTHKKKDDLADSFLQGLWYLSNTYKFDYDYKHK